VQGYIGLKVPFVKNYLNGTVHIFTASLAPQVTCAELVRHFYLSNKEPSNE
jgi:hypothetical protein